MTDGFVNRYAMDRRRYLHRYGRPDVSLGPTGIGWVSLLLFSAAMSVVAAVGRTPLFLVLFVPIAAFSADRIFLQGRRRADREFRRLAARRGADAWEVVVRLGDAVETDDGGEVSVVAWSRVRGLAGDRRELTLVLADGDGIRLDRAGFAPETDRAFVAWFRASFPELPSVRA